MRKRELTYHNDINKLELGKLTEKQQDIFFSLLYKFKSEEKNNIQINFSELKNISNLGRKNETLILNVRTLNKKLQAIVQEVEVEGKYITFSVFKEFVTDIKNSVIEVSLSDRFYYLLDNLIGNYTIMDLKELVNLKGNYAKTLYRLLKQWESIKRMDMPITEFRKIMGIPNSYKMFNIDQRVLEPCTEELRPLFSNLKCEKIKKGVKVDRIIFTWKGKEVKKNKKSEINRKKPSLGEKELQEYLLLQEKIEMNNVPGIEEKHKKEIPKAEFEKIYKKYLKDNNIPDIPSVKISFKNSLNLIVKE